jgi:hypothetical protein
MAAHFQTDSRKSQHPFKTFMAQAPIVNLPTRTVPPAITFMETFMHSCLSALQTTALVSVTAAATLLLMQACGGGARADAAPPDAIEGVWESAVTITDCTSGAVLRSFKGAGVFARGGALTADNSLPPATRSTAFGQWRNTGGQAYSAGFRFYRFNSDGSLAGSQRVQRNITLAADANGFTGTLTGQVLDNAGAVLAPVCGSETATRISF